MQDTFSSFIHHGYFELLYCCSNGDDTIVELNARNRVGGGLHDEFPVRDSSDPGHDFIDFTQEPLNRPPFVSGNESSSELDDQASSYVSFYVI